MKTVTSRPLLPRLRLRQGTAVVELGIAVPVLMLVVWALIDFARGYYTVNAMETAVREGARYAAVQINPSSSATASLIRAKTEAAFYPFGSPALTDGQVVIYDSTATAGTVTVQIKNYQWSTLTLLSRTIGKSLLLSRQATFRWERAAP